MQLEPSSATAAILNMKSVTVQDDCSSIACLLIKSRFTVLWELSAAGICTCDSRMAPAGTIFANMTYVISLCQPEPQQINELEAKSVSPSGEIVADSYLLTSSCKQLAIYKYSMKDEANQKEIQ